MNFKDDGIIKIANIDKIGESKEVVVFNPKFKVVYFDFEVGKGLPNHTHNGYASIFIYEGSVSTVYVSRPQKSWKHICSCSRKQKREITERSEKT